MNIVFSFRPLTGDLSSLQTITVMKRHGSPVSVPLQGTYLLYPNRLHHDRVVPSFPSPYRGLIFFTVIIMIKNSKLQVSVPLQGTYLLYQPLDFLKARGQGFPSPYRGLIFFTKLRDTVLTRKSHVSVPLQGTYLPYFAFWR